MQNILEKTKLQTRICNKPGVAKVWKWHQAKAKSEKKKSISPYQTPTASKMLTTLCSFSPWRNTDTWHDKSSHDIMISHDKTSDKYCDLLIIWNESSCSATYSNSASHSHSRPQTHLQFSLVQLLSCVWLRPHESQHARPPCPSPTPGVYSNPCPSSWWCHPAISSSVVPFSSCPQSLPEDLRALFKKVYKQCK